MEKKTCPTCGAQATVLIVNLANQQRFCHNCANWVCPTFMAHYVFTREDVAWLRACGIDPEVPRIEDGISKPRCKRSTGTERACFRTRAEAEAFAADPANPNYHGDVAHLCAKCDLYHLSRPEWLEPELTHRDAALLSSMGVAVPEMATGDFKCAQCHVQFRAGIDFLILSDGRMVCGSNCGLDFPGNFQGFDTILTR